jgi:integrase/recombinase XerD
MTQTTKPISPLRQRMIDDMRMRRLSDRTQSHYIRAVVKFTRFLGHSPDTATAEDLRRYQLHLVLLSLYLLLAAGAGQAIERVIGH